eukprot:3931745-Rhodomonas_salina.3
MRVPECNAWSVRQRADPQAAVSLTRSLLHPPHPSPADTQDCQRPLAVVMLSRQHAPSLQLSNNLTTPQVRVRDLRWRRSEAKPAASFRRLSSDPQPPSHSSTPDTRSDISHSTAGVPQHAKSIPDSASMWQISEDRLDCRGTAHLLPCALALASRTFPASPPSPAPPPCVCVCVSHTQRDADTQRHRHRHRQPHGHTETQRRT